MKMRDTAVSNDGRLAAGRWLKSLREARGLSQSDLAAHLGETHYTFVSQMETGRRSIPAVHIERLATVLGVARRDFAIELLSHQNPFLHSAIFGDEARFAELTEALMIERDQSAFSLQKPILSALVATREEGMSLAELQARVEKAVGRELHYQSVSQTLRKLTKDDLVRKTHGRWRATEKALA